MSRTPMRRIASAATAAALATAGVVVGVGLGTGVASAAGTCSATSHLTKNDASTLGMTMTYGKTVAPASVATSVPQTVTYSIVVGTTSGAANPYVNAITDFPPTGFGAPTTVTVSAYHILQGQQTATVTAEPANGGYQVTNSGWFVNSGNPVTANFTYNVPSNVTLGQAVTSGGANVSGTEGVTNSMPTLTACFAVGAPNAGQAVTGSLANNGLGSSQGGLSSTGSVSDILGNAISKGIEGVI
ncbi:hypothetical protein [Speluncibacter jeojiensis]|uniref:Uncharacterized protein n=1 Tax=Speluncibacter jeojiensis TaxID=2710754 RepID=A0A9X4RF66_9ACTN|nr:hypothetical protein [Corynebacteriales bacterium D3-21]